MLGVSPDYQFNWFAILYLICMFVTVYLGVVHLLHNRKVLVPRETPSCDIVNKQEHHHTIPYGCTSFPDLQFFNTVQKGEGGSKLCSKNTDFI